VSGFFFIFRAWCRKGIELQQADEFNESFQSLLKNSLLAVVIFILHLVFSSLVIYWQLFVYNQ
jgi:hypothetical protein